MLSREEEKRERESSLLFANVESIICFPSRFIYVRSLLELASLENVTTLWLVMECSLPNVLSKLTRIYDVRSLCYLYTGISI